MKYEITTQAQVKSMFWESHPKFKRIPGKKQNDYPADIRVSFCDFVERLWRNNQISDKLADLVTL